jgi:hypothetical protein
MTNVWRTAKTATNSNGVHFSALISYASSAGIGTKLIYSCAIFLLIIWGETRVTVSQMLKNALSNVKVI